MAAVLNSCIPVIYNSSIIDDEGESIVGKNSSACPIVLLLLIANHFTPQVITISVRQPSEEEERLLLCNQSCSIVINEARDEVIVRCIICSPASRI